MPKRALFETAARPDATAVGARSIIKPQHGARRLDWEEGRGGMNKEEREEMQPRKTGIRAEGLP